MTDHGFGPHATMALYDQHRNRVTPWYPVDTYYPGEPHTTGGHDPVGWGAAVAVAPGHQVVRRGHHVDWGSVHDDPAAHYLTGST